MIMHDDKATISAPRLLGYLLLPGGTISSSVLITSIAGKDHGGISAGYFILLSLGAVGLGVVGVLVGCITEQRPKEGWSWLIIGFIMIVSVFALVYYAN